MAKRNDMQTIMLSVAAQRPSYSLYPLPDTLKPGARVSNAITSLIDKGFAAKQETSDRAAFHRSDGDIGYSVFATEAGLAAIGVIEDAGEGAGAPQREPRITKTASVIALLSREQGTTLAELIAATGWLPHMTRAALTGLRKKGHVIERTKRDHQTCYRILVRA